MNEILDKILLFLASLIMYLLDDYSLYAVIPAMLTILLSCLFYYFENPRATLIGNLIYAALCIFVPGYIFFLPFLLYDLFHDKYQVFSLITIILFIINAEYYSFPTFLFTLVLLLTSLLVKYKTDKINALQTEYNELRDSSSSYSQLLEEKNRSILKNHDYEISLATLNERNRISKEIHDNIGHLLSRAILQVGALLTISKDKPIHDELSNLKDSLSSRMDDIRSSIHNMHDDSVDLYNQTEKIIKEFTFCKIYFDYDVSNQPPIAGRYCFIAIVKEALSNVMKHSNASRVNIILREHPGLYQLIIWDNGSLNGQMKSQINQYLETGDYKEGMGLRNIIDRVRGFNGNLNITMDEGFKIFITIPKKAPVPVNKL